jgi:hypothetical protein
MRRARAERARRPRVNTAPHKVHVNSGQLFIYITHCEFLSSYNTFWRAGTSTPSWMVQQDELGSAVGRCRFPPSGKRYRVTSKPKSGASPCHGRNRVAPSPKLDPRQKRAALPSDVRTLRTRIPSDLFGSYGNSASQRQGQVVYDMAFDRALAPSWSRSRAK